MTTGRVLLAGAALLLLLTTVLVFLAFDHHSHSSSHTLRPFLITMTPVWLLAFLVERRLRRRTGRRG